MSDIKLEFDLDYIKILEEDDDVSIVQLDLLHLGTNRNKCNISKECIDKSLPSFFNKPIIYRLNNKIFIGESTDVVEHARDEEQEKTIFIGGTIPESSPVEYVERNDKTYLRMIGVIHKLYQKTLVSILENRDGEIKISIELKVVSGKQDENGILIIDEFKFLSACLLGKGIMEGIEGSQLVVTKFSLDDYNQHYLTFTKNEDKYKIPEIIKNNIQSGLDLKNKYVRGGSTNIINNAKNIISLEYISFEQVQNYYENSIKYQKYSTCQEDVPSNNFISSLLCGGKEGYLWFQDIIKNKEKEGEKLKDSEKIEDTKINSEEEKIENSNKGNSVEEEVIKNIQEKEGEDVNKAIEKFNLTSNQIYEILGNVISEIKYKNGDWEYRKYWVSDYTDEFVLLYDNEEDKKYQFPYSIENEVATINFDEKKEAINGAWKIVGEESETIINSDETEHKDVELETLKNSYADLEQKFAALEKECKMAQDKVQEFETKEFKAEELVKMNSLLEEFAHCYSDEEMSEVKNKLETMTYADLDTEVTNKAKEFAKKAKETKSDEKSTDEEVKEDDKKNDEEDKKDVKNTLQFSISPFGMNPTYDFSKNLGQGGLDSIIKNSGVKV